MKELYRVKKGKLSCKNHELPIDFGLIFEEDGQFFFDFYISESYDLMTLMENEDDVFLREEFVMNAITIEENFVEASSLSATNVNPNQSKISMQSYGHLSHITVQTDTDGNKIEYREKDPTLYYIELEGLKMEFSDLTEVIRARGGVQIKDYNGWQRDYTKALLVYDSTNISSNNFKMDFYKSTNSENIVVAFPNYRNVNSNILPYRIFKELRRDFISLLSLLNGAEVAVRKEYIGGFFNDNVVGSQEVITYSFKTIRNERHSSYVPLNSGFHRGVNILNHVFIKCFNKYVTENKKLDFNSIIFYLNGAQKSNGIEEKFFIQIIAFERLAQKYVEAINDNDIFILSEETFKPIKKDLLSVLKNHSIEMGDKLDKLSAKIGDLHKIKKTSTEYKSIKLLEYAKITINPDIQHIIDEVRHKTIHHGEIGNGNQGIKNYLVLDELLRDIILNIVEYDQERISKLNPTIPWKPGKKTKATST